MTHAYDEHNLPDAINNLGELLDYVPGIVLAAVVYKNYFPRFSNRVHCRTKTRKQLGEVSLFVIYGDYN